MKRLRRLDVPLICQLKGELMCERSVELGFGFVNLQADD